MKYAGVVNSKGKNIMNKIVNDPIRVDLHIHSVHSYGKGGKRVESNTEENIPVLVSRLQGNGINMCAITDHDTFSF